MITRSFNLDLNVKLEVLELLETSLDKNSRLVWVLQSTDQEHPVLVLSQSTEWSSDSRLVLNMFSPAVLLSQL